ncbi:MAG: hypothetical protein DI535_11115 [Citrobacter freundii]|nr:MAG: hypothetical protein DI535_11115 [Citrobacter freundii]
MKKIMKKIVWLFAAAPVIYLIIIWKSLPAKVPMHFDLQGTPDRYGDKTELWGSAALMLVVSIGSYLLVTNIHRIDPKRYAKEMQDKYDKIGISVMIFLSVIHFFVIYSAAHSSFALPPGMIFAAVSILFAILGNYMYNIKPNYFVGVRLPWTLASDDNWKKTHNLAGRIWFIAGIVMAILCLVLPALPAMILFFAGLAVMIIIPIIYSYQLFIKEKHSK